MCVHAFMHVCVCELFIPHMNRSLDHLYAYNSVLQIASVAIVISSGLLLLVIAYLHLRPSKWLHAIRIE